MQKYLGKSKSSGGRISISYARFKETFFFLCSDKDKFDKNCFCVNLAGSIRSSMSVFFLVFSFYFSRLF
jgi:hypothetical protein